MEFTDASTESYNISNDDPSAIYYSQVMRTIEIWQRITTIVLGSMGNCLSVVIFCSTNLRNLSSSYYLSALAISDTAFLAVLLLTWLQDVGFDILLESFFCCFQIYLSQAFGFLSVWFVVAFTVERFIAVQYPLSRPSMCTVSRAKKVIAGLTITGLIIYLPYLAVEAQVGYLKGARYKSCQSEWTLLAATLNTVDIVITMMIPCVAIVSANICICITVSRLSRRRRKMTINGGNRLTDSGRSHKNSTRHNNSQNKVTRLLLVVSTVFVGLNIPNYIFRLLYYLPNNQVQLSELTVSILAHVGLMLYYTTFGINFVLYCVTGQNFRKTMFSLCCPRRARLHDATRVTVVSECGRASVTRRRTLTTNGSTTEAHEMVPLAL